MHFRTGHSFPGRGRDPQPHGKRKTVDIRISANAVENPGESGLEQIE